MQYFLFFGIFTIMHILVWIGTNWQLTDNADPQQALVISVICAIPISLLAFYGTRIGYSQFGSVWSIRLIVFGISYITFPL